MRIELNKQANAEMVFQALHQVAPKGANVYITWERECKTRKDVNCIVTKRVTAPIRYGISYGNIRAIKDAIQSGERDAVQPLASGQWRKGFENLIIDDKDKEKCRFEVSSFANMKRTSEYFIDGIPTTFDSVSSMLLASEIKKKSSLLVFDLNPKNIIAVGAE